MSSPRRILVYGGSGALGRACVQYFRSNNWWVGSVDLCANDDADANVNITNTESWTAQEREVVDGVDAVLNGSKVDAVVCVAGGWAGGNASNDDLVKNTDLMIKQSVWSSIIASKLAAKYLTEDGILTLTGAKAALEPTPGMIGYGLAKAAVHQLVQSLAANKSGIPNKASVVAILPVTLDTPMNRKFMPKADFSKWTSLVYVAELIHDWASSQQSRPKSGSLVQLVTNGGQTELIFTESKI